MVRDLKQIEEKGTIIRRKDGIGHAVIIIGSTNESPMHPESGFFVRDFNYKMPFPLILSFNKIKEWEVVE